MQAVQGRSHIQFDLLLQIVALYFFLAVARALLTALRIDSTSIEDRKPQRDAVVASRRDMDVGLADGSVVAPHLDGGQPLPDCRAVCQPDAVFLLLLRQKILAILEGLLAG